MEQPEHFSEKLLARHWGLSHRTLERWRHNGSGPEFLKIGGRIIYRRADIQTYEAARRRTTEIVSQQAAEAAP